MIRTKIVATMGPACSDIPRLHAIFDGGVSICRLNFSHGTLENHGRMLLNIREAAVYHGQPIAVLGDLGGPKIRLGEIKDIDQTGGMPIAPDQELLIQRQPIPGENLRASSTYLHLVDDVKIGDRVLIEDGSLQFVCVGKATDEIRCRCSIGGVLKSSKGINLPNTTVNVPSITDRDWECVDWALENELDYLALSFVRKADDIELVRARLKQHDSSIHLIAKIEKAEAVGNIDSIIDAADGLMIARGDLGVEMDVADVPIIQKDLIRRCQTRGKPVIVATQMLQSMIEQPTPTRAEVSDVANAIFDGTDAVMLSGETSVGKYPAAAVLTMAHVAAVTENYLDSTDDREHVPRLKLKLKARQSSVAIATGVREMCAELNAKAVVVYSTTGTTARIFSKHRFPVPIIGLSANHAVLRRMALNYGVIPCEMAPSSDLVELVSRVDRLVQELQHASVGDRILIVAGASLSMPGTMPGIIIHSVGEHWSPTSGT